MQSKIASRCAGLTRRFTLLAACSALLACSESGAGLVALPDSTPSRYLLGPGDQLRIITFGETQLSGDFRVDAAGSVHLPLVGRLRAEGLTPDQLAAEITARLQQSNLLRQPSVSVEVVAYRPVFILGEVNRPGQYAYQPGMTVLTAVAIAGGFTYRAVTDRFSIVRTTPHGSIEGAATRKTPLQPGDVVTVYERIF